MNVALRQTLSAIGVVTAVALVFGAAASTAIAIRDQRDSVTQLSDEVDALKAREQRLQPPPGRDPNASPLFVADTITVAGAALQQRLEAAVAAAKGTLVSSKVDVATRPGDRRVAVSAELTIAEPDMQALLFDLETGRPYLFVEAIEARSPEGAGEHGPMRVSLDLSGQWSGAK